MTLWTSADAESATLGKASARFAVNGLSIDTRTLKEGDLFVALKGDNRDGHDYVGAAFAAKAGAALVSRAPRWRDRSAAHRRRYPAWARRSGPRRPRPQQCQNPGHHRQRRQDHHQGNSALCPERAGPHPCLGRVLQQSLGRAAVAGRACRRIPNMACSKSA